MKRKIRFSLVYRDMWQSSGKYQPRVDQLKEVAPHIIEMGCFDRIETNGGAFEQVQLMAGVGRPATLGELTEPSKPGDPVNSGERICYIQTSSYIDEIISPFEGVVAEIVVLQGTNVNKGDILFKIKELKKKKPREKSENQ